ncbi:MAG: integrase core domain-containing protein [Anaerolineales bacterium]
MHHDQDPVFTGYGWTGQLLLEDHVRVSYALNGARDTILAQGNPEMESFISRFKTENRSLLLDAQRLGDLQSLVRERMAYHNGERRHSTIGYRAPAAYVATLSHGRSLSWRSPVPAAQAQAGQGITIPMP